jgi:tRNA modification GTPase
MINVGDFYLFEKCFIETLQGQHPDMLFLSAKNPEQVVKLKE